MNDEVARVLAYKIKYERTKKGLSQQELSSKTGIIQADISKLERSLANPSLNTLIRVANGLDLDLEINFKERDEKEENK